MKMCFTQEFVNDIRADLHDEGTVYACLDNHKYGDYKPYLFKSSDKGITWQSIANNLPEKLMVWRIVQDHVDPNLLFIATEFGIYFSNNGGGKWTQLKGGLPTISFRDITIQRRENDLVAASFGRGFYVLDDISALRNMNDDAIAGKEAKLFPSRPAYWYAQKQSMYGQGDNEYKAPNPDYGATFTYYLKEGLAESSKKKRIKAEKKLAKDKKDIPFPGWDALDESKNEETAAIYLTIKDNNGDIINRVKGKSSKGLNRTAWNLQMASNSIIKLEQRSGGSGNWFGGGGYQVTPGTYNVTLSKIEAGIETALDGPMDFEVKPLLEPTIKGASYEEIIAFRDKYETFSNDLSETNTTFSKAKKMLAAMKSAYEKADKHPTELRTNINDFQSRLRAVDRQLSGNKSKREIGEKQNPLPGDGSLLGWVALSGTYGPTGNHKQALNRAINQLSGIKGELESLMNEIPALRKSLKTAGAPDIEAF